MNQEKMLETAIDLLQDAFVIIKDENSNSKSIDSWIKDVRHLLFCWQQQSMGKQIASKLNEEEIEYLRLRGVNL